MVLEIWGQLPKSQDDPEKIEEAIQRLVQAHNNDPEAHTAEGQSLQSHKASEIIDHAIKSIIADKIKEFQITPEKLNYDKIAIETIFESLDNWATFESEAGILNIRAQIGGLELRCNGSNGKWIEINVYPYVIEMSCEKNPIFQTTLKVIEGGTNNVDYYLVIGSDVYSEGLGPYIGFKISNGTIYAVHSYCEEPDTPTEIATEIEGINPTQWHTYRAVIDYTNNKIEYYIDDVLVSEHTENLPWQYEYNQPYMLFNYAIKNNSTTGGRMYIQKAIFIQDK